MLILRFVVLLCLTVTFAYLHGNATYRWKVPAALLESDASVRKIPKELGDWKFFEDADRLRNEVIEELGVTEYVSRIYVRGQDTVSLLLMSGKTGRLIRHTPDICYASTGNQFLAKPTDVELEVDGVKHQFKILSVRPSSTTSGDFVVVYGFARNGVFISPDSPRIAFHGEPAVQKIQVLCRVDGEQINQIPLYAQPFIEDVCRHIARSPSATESE